MATIVLLHSPLVGPESLLPTARELQRRGWGCEVPTHGARPGEVPPWRELAERFAANVKSDTVDVVSGHSASGNLMPAVAALVGAQALLFLESQVPPPNGHVRPSSGQFAEFLGSLPVRDGRLPRWSEWWEGRIPALFPDRAAYERFERELPELPVAWFDDEAAVPPWKHLPAGYIQMSPAYDEEFGRAKAAGWPVLRIEGTHLTPGTDAVASANAIEHVLLEMGIRAS